MKRKKSYQEDATTGFLLYAATFGLKKRLAQALTSSGYQITPEQQALLIHLWNKDGISQSDLAAHSFKDRHNVSRIIKGLEQKGLLKKLPDASDARLNRCVLTEKGQALKEPLLTLGQENMEISLKGIKKKEIENLRKTLMRILDNLEEDL